MEHLLEMIKNFETGYPILMQLIKISLVVIFSVIFSKILKKYILSIIEKIIKKTKNEWDDIIFGRKVFNRIFDIIPAAVIYISAYLIPQAEILIERVALSYIALIMLIVISNLLNAVNDIYELTPKAKERSIKGIIQTINIAFYAVGAVVIISIIMGKSPLIILSGVGAMTAVLMLVFKDTLLSFVAGLQLNYNEMISKGDWISMPSFQADGTVIDIALHTVKVQNWDKTITTIPTYALMQNSFKNWKGMEKSGGRRICRNLFIDISSVKFLTAEEIEKLKNINLLKDYLESKEKEIAIYNHDRNISSEDIINGRNLTNIGTFREYIRAYITNNPMIRKDMTILVRQLEATPTGLPMQLYLFTDTTEWIKYEAIQSDIFDHLFAVAPEFDIRLFQNPSGKDFRKLT